MKLTIRNLMPLMKENQAMLGQIILYSAQANGFGTEDWLLTFGPDDGEPSPDDLETLKIMPPQDWEDN